MPPNGSCKQTVRTLILPCRRASQTCARGKPAHPALCHRTISRCMHSMSSHKQQINPTMEQLRQHYSKRNETAAYYILSAILGTVALSYGSVPLYKTFCQQTGWGGQPVRHDEEDEANLSTRLTPVTDASRIRITFAGSTSDILPWKFTPQQREVKVLPGETALAFYTATNESDADIIGIATYSVSPPQVAPYFSKIQCFCFEEQRLNGGETVDMPVFFYIDPEFLGDPNMRGIQTVTLNYTFFKARYDNNGVLTPVPQAL